MLDYSGFLFLTTTCRPRTASMFGTLSNVMANVRNAVFVVLWTDDVNRSERCLHYLGLIANATNNRIIHKPMPGASVAVTKKPPFLSSLDFKYFINLDDDLLTTYDLWDTLLVRATENPTVVHTIGCVDADNSRGYADYDQVRYESIEAFKRVHALSKAKVHYFKSKEYIDYSWLSQLYCMPRPIWDDHDLWAPILDAFGIPGIRGYDIMLEQRLLAMGYKIAYQSGVEALHFGMDGTYLSGNWTSASDVIHSHVRFKDSQ